LPSVVMVNLALGWLLDTNTIALSVMPSTAMVASASMVNCFQTMSLFLTGALTSKVLIFGSKRATRIVATPSPITARCKLLMRSMRRRYNKIYVMPNPGCQPRYLSPHSVFCIQKAYKVFLGGPKKNRIRSRFD